MMAWLVTCQAVALGFTSSTWPGCRVPKWSPSATGVAWHCRSDQGTGKPLAECL